MKETSAQHGVIEALRHGAQEINNLKRERELLAIKAQAFDAMAGLVALLMPRQSQSYSVDASWLMNKALIDFEAELAAQQAGAETAEEPTV